MQQDFLSLGNTKMFKSQGITDTPVLNDYPKMQTQKPIHM